MGPRTAPSSALRCSAQSTRVITRAKEKEARAAQRRFDAQSAVHYKGNYGRIEKGELRGDGGKRACFVVTSPLSRRRSPRLAATLLPTASLVVIRIIATSADHDHRVRKHRDTNLQPRSSRTGQKKERLLQRHDHRGRPTEISLSRGHLTQESFFGQITRYCQQ